MIQSHRCPGLTNSNCTGNVTTRIKYALIERDGQASDSQTTMPLEQTVLLVTTTFVFISARTLTYTDCGSSVPVISVGVHPCSQSPCTLTRGDTTIFRIQFQADENTRSLGQAEVHSIIWGVAVPFALDTPEICGDVQPNCPLRPRDRCTYKKSIYIPPTHSRIKSVKMKPCRLRPCELTKSGKDTIQIVFQADSNSGSPGDSGFYGIFEGTSFPFFVERPKICDNIKPSCPLKPRSWYTYKNSVSTSEAYPNIQLTGRWVLKNTEGKLMVCVQFPIQIVET
ncbi:Phosphatidylglycerol/phosphatidylinositol transfer protein [Clonorchis sinensis]|uniref:Phosphatidylglycerol/phosphatidylinositol transfer protein n=1 Tax=Clonorchis sinensis TaxID=79923 RepID=A0A419PVR1_CLOSI|nr:Phosphatidylglycerol/phosphatidylinositol transfer protein [Clonorchis sinensis]